jgi:aryl-alcohol dehydrogenase-like predicted oxidoreductase
MTTDTPPWARRRAEGESPFVALGTMNFGKRTPEKEAARIVARATERGVRVFDTANAYNDGESERILGRALRGKTDGMCIATKVGFGRIAGKPEGLAPARVRAALDESLTRLGVERVGLYYLHVPDHATPIEATLAAVGELFAAGKVERVGVSNYASWQILEGLHACRGAGLEAPVVAQQLYNLLIRQLDGEYFRFAAKYGLHTTVYNPLAGGLLTGRYHAGSAIAPGSRFDKNHLYQGRYWSERMLSLAGSYEAIARELGLGLTELAYAWLAGVQGVDSILVGPTTVEQLDQALDAVTLANSLGTEVRVRIDETHRSFLGTETFYAR